ncbi:NADH:flavin oxidoreductase [[Mycoplasma] mobile]|uniref:NADH:flavin oxidoreductases n=1 Tax=Mycoplasma mobile (strain ATCC 43663 / 163K / NCTC 11711) TaxID=267748 RepID=Q6KIM2_MYCM1|nr:NADH:flavin oxidoreductase [[Mycoplasma] mobile]AAT27554.1 NADH:flavin oxidoreductases [Mycoplasma mobile 163K]
MLKPKNRIAMLPMDTKMAKNGFVNDFHVQHYGARIWGEVGTIIVESVAVSPEGRIEHDDLGIWSDEHIEGYKHLVRLAKVKNALIGLQLNHASSASFDKENKINVSTKYDKDQNVKLATISQLNQIIENFILAAKRAKKAGVDFVEIHAAHGYLFSQLISPITNEINPSENIVERSRLLIDFVKRLKKEVDIPFGIRLSVNDYFPNGNTAKDFKPLIKELEKYVIYFNVSSWILSGAPLLEESVKKTKLYRLEDALTIKSFTNKQVIASGNFNTKEDIDFALNKGIDFVGIGRELLFNPNFLLNNYFSPEELKTQNFEWVKGNRFYNHIQYLEDKIKNNYTFNSRKWDK